MLQYRQPLINLTKEQQSRTDWPKLTLNNEPGLRCALGFNDPCLLFPKSLSLNCFSWSRLSAFVWLPCRVWTEQWHLQHLGFRSAPAVAGWNSFLDYPAFIWRSWLRRRRWGAESGGEAERGHWNGSERSSGGTLHAGGYGAAMEILVIVQSSPSSRRCLFFIKCVKVCDSEAACWGLLNPADRIDEPHAEQLKQNHILRQ